MLVFFPIGQIGKRIWVGPVLSHRGCCLPLWDLYALLGLSVAVLQDHHAWEEKFERDRNSPISSHFTAPQSHQPLLSLYQPVCSSNLILPGVQPHLLQERKDSSPMSPYMHLSPIRFQLIGFQQHQLPDVCKESHELEFWLLSIVVVSLGARLFPDVSIPSRN